MTSLGCDFWLVWAQPQHRGKTLWGHTWKQWLCVHGGKAWRGVYQDKDHKGQTRNCNLEKTRKEYSGAVRENLALGRVDVIYQKSRRVMELISTVWGPVCKALLMSALVKWHSRVTVRFPMAIRWLFVPLWAGGTVSLIPSILKQKEYSQQTGPHQPLCVAASSPSR